MAIIGYTRVSTDRQAEEGLSLETQRARIEGYCAMQGIALDAVLSDTASGSTPIRQRPAGAELLQRARKGDSIVVVKLDRAFRNAADALATASWCKERGISLVLIDLGGDVTGNGLAKVFFTIVAAFAEFERDRISERQLDAKAAAKADGRYRGGKRPYGFNIVDGELVKVPLEQEMITLARSLRAQGEPLRSIRATLHGRHGCHLSLGAINRITSEPEPQTS